jgi:hypothetical protein
VLALYCVATVRDILRGMCPRSTVGQEFKLYCGQVSAHYSEASVSALMYVTFPCSTVEQVSALHCLSDLLSGMFWRSSVRQVYGFYSAANVRTQIRGKCPRSTEVKSLRSTLGSYPRPTVCQVSALYCGARVRALMWSK